nr:TetR/AcrR family transcriptional regulator [uncultured Blautia sp.]
MNEKFQSLSQEKQQAVINAAMEVFGKNEYKRASTDLIAAKAGISKGLLFYYFRNKKELYLYIYNCLIETMQEQILDEKFKEITDFFDLLRYATTLKVQILERYPFILDFAMRAFYSEKEDVSDELKNVNTMQEDVLFQLCFGHIDTSKFKEEVEPFKVYKMLRWMGDGYIHDVQMSGAEFQLDEMMKEFEEWMDMFQMLVYKDEFRKK